MSPAMTATETTTAHAVPLFIVNSTGGTTRAASAVPRGEHDNDDTEQAIVVVTDATSLESERERFRQQVRESLTAEMALVTGEPTASSESWSSRCCCNGWTSSRSRRVRMVDAAVLLVLIVTAVTTAAVVGTRKSRNSPSVSNDEPTLQLPLSSQPSSNEGIVVNATLPPIVLPNGRLAFTETLQLYQAVDDYDAALQANGTAQDSLVAIQYGYPMGEWDVSRLADFSRVFMLERLQRLDLDFRAQVRSMPIADLSDWNVSRATTMQGMFAGAVEFTGDGLTDWDVSLVKDFSFCFAFASEFVGDLSKWNTSHAVSMTAMLVEASSFSGDVSLWDVARVESMSSMFAEARNFNSDLSRWNVSQVRDMSSMLAGTEVFRGDGLTTWQTTSLERIDGMFSNAKAFSGDVTGFSVDKVTSLDWLFTNTPNFVGGDFSGWNVSRVTSMFATFGRCSSFDGSIGSWDVSKVHSFDMALEYCENFHSSDLSRWNTSSARYMRQMFKDAWVFNGNLSSWNTSNVEDMFEMFHNANAFNSDLSDWNLSSLREASRMFKEAESFNQTLCSWGDSLPVDAVVADMFAQSDCNYKADPTMDNASLSWSGPFCSPCDD